MLINNNGLANEYNGQRIAGEIFTDEATKEKIHTHLTNLNDTITDEDLLKVKTVMTPATIEEERDAANDAGIDIPNDGI